MIENIHQRPVLISKREGGIFSQKRKPGEQKKSSLPAEEADAAGEGAMLEIAEGAESGGIDVVVDDEGVLAIGDVIETGAQGPFEPEKMKPLFDVEIQRGVIGEADLAGQADKLLLEVDNVVGIAGAPVEGVIEFEGVNPGQTERRGAPGLDAVRRVPGKRPSELRTEKGYIESGIQNRIRASLRARVRKKQRIALPQGVAEGERRRVE